MGLALVLHATERSTLESSAPTTAEVVNALRYVERGDFGGRSRTNLNGGWVGPAPRVTRTAPVGAFVTQAAWVWALDDAQAAASGLTDPAARQAFIDRLVADAHASLRQRATHNSLSDNWTVETATYSETVNGPLSWWQSGAAASDARFINAFPELTTRSFPVDNPVGPNRAPEETPFSSGLKTLAWIIGGVAVTVGIIELAPILSASVGIARRASHAEPHPNPRRRRR